jgi:hypothetical protein
MRYGMAFAASNSTDHSPSPPKKTPLRRITCGKDADQGRNSSLWVMSGFVATKKNLLLRLWGGGGGGGGGRQKLLTPLL